MHIKSERNKVLTAVLGGVSVFIFLAALTAIIRFSNTESLPAKLAPENAQEVEEEIFSIPRPVIWEGSVLSVTSGGSSYAIQFSNGEAFLAVWPDNRSQIISGHVIINGYWVGTTCAYRFTLFGGKCVPEVEISEMKSF